MIIGIDPGLSGALAFIDKEGLTILDMPTLTTKKGAKKRTNIDAYTLGRIIEADAHNFKHCYIEEVHSMPSQGISSAFNFGKGFGMLIGIIAANFIPMTLIPPQQWKKDLRVPAEKDGAIARASELLPKYSHLWPLKKHDGRAEAALLAYWGSKQI